MQLIYFYYLFHLNKCSQIYTFQHNGFLLCIWFEIAIQTQIQNLIQFAIENRK